MKKRSCKFSNAILNDRLVLLTAHYYCIIHSHADSYWCDGIGDDGACAYTQTGRLSRIMNLVIVRVDDDYLPVIKFCHVNGGGVV